MYNKFTLGIAELADVIGVMFVALTNFLTLFGGKV